MCPLCLSTVALLVSSGTGAAGGAAVLFGKSLRKRRAMATSAAHDLSVPRSGNANCPLAQHRAKMS